jgi:membrane protease YdiL (CAAX protease family)
MRIGQPTGLQIAFLAFAVMLLAAPLTNAAVRLLALEGPLLTLAQKGAHFFLACLLIVAVPPMRLRVTQMLRVPIPRSMRTEVIAAWLLKLAAAFGGVAALALWFLVQEGPVRVESMTVDVDRAVVNAYSRLGLMVLFLSTTIGPVIEEIVFRGFMYRAFERQWGWVVSLLATSALFGLYHPHFWSAFTSSVILICLLRRTGSLWAPILVHMFYNLMLWWPLLGQYAFPHGVVLTDPWSWLFHGICLAFAVIAVPGYVYMSRERNVTPTLFLEPNGALQK